MKVMATKLLKKVPQRTLKSSTKNFKKVPQRTLKKFHKEL